MHFEGSIGEVTDARDRIGVAIRAIRAIETGDARKLGRCLMQFPAMSAIIPRRELSCGLRDRGKTLQDVKNFTAKLIKEDLMTELDNLRKQQKELSTSDYVQRRNRLWDRIKNLKPGEAKTIGAIASNSGEILTEPSEVAGELREHWKACFFTQKRFNIHEEGLDEGDGR